MARARRTRRPSVAGSNGQTHKTGKPRKATGEAAPPRGSWSGSISFGLLQIPVTLYGAERRTEQIHLRLLDKHDLAPIKYQRVNAESGKPVAWGEIVKGYEYEPGNFVVLGDEDLKKANVQATQTIDIQDFVPADDIDPAFFETPYYTVPHKRATKAYVLLREALRQKQAVAIGTFVFKTREHLCALMPSGNAIMLEVLRFGHELRKPRDLPLPGDKDSVRFNEKELAMAERLVEEMMGKWDPSKYHDRYHEDVMKMVEQKVKTGRTRAVNAKAKGAVASNVVDLVAILQKSLKAKGGRDERRKAA